MSRGERARERRAGNLDCGGKRSATPLSIACRRRAYQSAVALRLPAQSKAGRERREVLRHREDEREFSGQFKGRDEQGEAGIVQDCGRI